MGPGEGVGADARAIEPKEHFSLFHWPPKLVQVFAGDMLPPRQVVILPAVIKNCWPGIEIFFSGPVKLSGSNPISRSADTLSAEIGVKFFNSILLMTIFVPFLIALPFSTIGGVLGAQPLLSFVIGITELAEIVLGHSKPAKIHSQD